EVIAYPCGMASSHESLAALAWLVDAGADEAVLDAPVDRLTARPAAAPPQPAKTPAAFSGRGGAAPSNPTPKSASQISTLPQGEGERRASAAVTYPQTAMPTSVDEIGNAQALAGGASTLAELKAALESFDGC